MTDPFAPITVKVTVHFKGRGDPIVFGMESERAFELLSEWSRMPSGVTIQVATARITTGCVLIDLPQVSGIFVEGTALKAVNEIVDSFEKMF